MNVTDELGGVSFKWYMTLVDNRTEVSRKAQEYVEETFPRSYEDWVVEKGDLQVKVYGRR